MSFERGDLLLVPFPFTDLSATKQRPVLALTAPNVFGDFVALPVTSRPNRDPAIPLTDDDLASGLLPRPSWIRVDHPVTLHAGLVRKMVARVGTHVTAAAARRLCEAVGGETARDR